MNVLRRCLQCKGVCGLYHPEFLGGLHELRNKTKKSLLQTTFSGKFSKEDNRRDTYFAVLKQL